MTDEIYEENTKNYFPSKSLPTLRLLSQGDIEGIRRENDADLDAYADAGVAPGQRALTIRALLGHIELEQSYGELAYRAEKGELKVKPGTEKRNALGS